MSEREDFSPVEDWVDGEVARLDDDRLQQWLSANPERRMRELVEANLREQQLREAVRMEFTTAKVQARTEQAEAKITAFPSRRVVALGLAAALILSLFLLPWVRREAGVPVPEGQGVVATVVSSKAAVFAGWERDSLEEGAALRLESFELKEGSIELALPSEVSVELFAPLEGRFINDMRLELAEGRLNADVGERGKGFTVVTDAGDVIDLGTRFGVEAERNGEARVAVFSGVVEFHPKGGGNEQFLTLTEGESLRFSVLNGLRRWQQVALAAETAGLSDRPNAGIVREVRDNQGERAEGGREIKPFYGVVSEGMREGALAFTDKPGPHYLPYPGEEFPKYLIRADLIRTYYTFRHKKKYELTLTLAEPAEVYLLMLSPHEVPSWVEEQGFVRSGERLLVGPWHRPMGQHPGSILMDEIPYLTFEVWKAESAAGELVLGPPLISKTGQPVSNYGVAVKALQP